MAMTKLSQGDAADETGWLGEAAADNSHGAVVGYDLSGWADSVWVLHAMYEDVDAEPLNR